MLNSTTSKKLLVGVCMVLCLCVVIFTWNQGSTMIRACMFERNEAPAQENMKISNATIPVKKVPRKDTVNNAGAAAFFKEYEDAFNPTKQKPVVEPDPNKPETITTWWHAAAMIDWYVHSPIRQKCRKVLSMGNWHVCQDEPYTVKAPCLVYSFGINNDFSFDDAIAKLGCEVHSFDPSMNKTDHKRGDRSTFHNLGLGSANTDGFVPRQDEYVKGRNVWKIRTVKAIMKMLGHENRVIDVFKMDIEAYEWGILDNMMETDVLKHIRQLALEYHLFHDFPIVKEYVYIYNTVTRFREMGFREYSSGWRPKTRDLKRDQGDVKYVNAYFEKQPDWE